MNSRTISSKIRRNHLLRHKAGGFSLKTKCVRASWLHLICRLIRCVTRFFCEAHLLRFIHCSWQSSLLLNVIFRLNILVEALVLAFFYLLWIMWRLHGNGSSINVHSTNLHLTLGTKLIIKAITNERRIKPNAISKHLTLLQIFLRPSTDALNRLFTFVAFIA